MSPVASLPQAARTGAAGDEPPEAAPARSRWLSVAAVAVLAVAAVAVWWFGRSSGPPPVTARDVDRAVSQALDQAKKEQAEAPPAAAAAYRAIAPSLVTITHDRSGGSSLGAGTVVKADGSVLTALHVVDGAGAVQVQFADGTKATATVASQDPDKDIAVLTVDTLPDVVVPAVLGGGVPVGADVFAVGNPLGLLGSLSAGVVSATGRSIDVPSGRSLSGLLQFDAAVNPGNSGGPLLNAAGQVVGVVTALANPSQQSYFIGIGFAVPIQSAAGVGGGPQQ